MLLRLTKSTATKRRKRRYLRPHRLPAHPRMLAQGELRRLEKPGILEMPIEVQTFTRPRRMATSRCAAATLWPRKRKSPTSNVGGLR